MKEDHSKTNPGLHHLYRVTAMRHLTVLNESIEVFENFSNVNMMGSAEALRQERRRLITENAAYRDGAALLMAGFDPDKLDHHELKRQIRDGDIDDDSLDVDAVIILMT